MTTTRSDRAAHAEPWALSADEVAAGLGADPVAGLPERVAATRLAEAGANEVPTPNPWLTAAVAADAALVLAGLYLPPLRELLATQALTPAELGAVGLASLAGAVTVVVQRRTTHRAA